MSADKHRSLARRIAWLRYFSAIGADGSIACHRRVTGVKNYPHVTVDLLRLEHDGLLRRSRVKLGWFGSNGTATAFEATASGIAVLHEALVKHGKDFGPQSLVHATQTDRPNKHQRALRSLLPWERAKTVAASRRGLSIAS
jgi:hypothetical protein